MTRILALCFGLASVGCILNSNTSSTSMGVPSVCFEDAGTAPPGAGSTPPWSPLDTQSCSPGSFVVVGCSSACGVGTCTGDPVLRVCDGNVSADGCRAGACRLGERDDCNSLCPAVSFVSRLGEGDGPRAGVQRFDKLHLQRVNSTWHHHVSDADAYARRGKHLQLFVGHTKLHLHLRLSGTPHAALPLHAELLLLRA